MVIKKRLKNLTKRAIFGCFFVIIAVFGMLSGGLVTSGSVFAAPTDETTEVTEETSSEEAVVEESTNSATTSASGDASCKEALGALGWLVCPATGKISEAVDFLYGLIEDALVVNPVEMKDGSPIYEVWKYCRGITNIVFIIFFLVVIYSQLTGFGISNYGIKKALPKLIIAAILVNISFLICSLAVDLSNVIGNGLRGVFSTIAESAVGSSAGISGVSMTEIFTTLATGTALTIGAVVIAWNMSMFFLLIPVVLGAIVAVVTGLLTVALRQAVIALLVMISPLAIVVMILPNTEGLFKKWKSLLIKMLVFYPMFSLLFGASNLAGFAIIASANNGFSVLLGVAVQIFPLFFSWSLMRMSGTFLGDINSGLRGLAAGPLATNRAWAQSRMMIGRQNRILNGNPNRPSVRLMAFMNSRRVHREEEMKENAELLRNRGLAYHARRHYRRDGTVSRLGERAYRNQAKNAGYQREIARDKNNFNNGLGGMGRDAAQTARLRSLDNKTVEAFDALKMEQARGEWIDYENARSFYDRVEDARTAHSEEMNGYDVDPNTGQRTPKQNFRLKFNLGSPEQVEAISRYNMMKQTMDNNEFAVEYGAAVAANGYQGALKAVGNRFATYWDMIPPSKELEYRIKELTDRKDAAKYIDAILPGLRVINQRGDTDVVLEQIKAIMRKDANHDGLTLGTHASQAIASFLMFEVKDSDPWLRRFGKYINMETAKLYDKNDPRTVVSVNYDEYIKGYHMEPDAANPGQQRIMFAKKGLAELMEGTSLDNLERTAFDSYDQSLRDAFTTVDANGNKHLDVDAYLAKKGEVEKATGAAFISSSLKYLSGSEQLVSAVKSKTGFISKQDPATGKTKLVPIWEDPSTMAKYGMTGHEEEVRQFYQRGTLQYLADQSPNQILGLRSDYREPLMQHLYDAYIEDDAADWSDEERAEREEYIERMNRAQAEYANLPDGVEKDRVAGEIAELRQKMVGAKFRQLLDSKGKLEQIYTTRRSGAANNAKDWVRAWLNLDDPREIQRTQERNRRKRDRADRGQTHDSDAGNMPNNHYGQYTPADVANFRDSLVGLTNTMTGATVDEFYDATVTAIESTFGGIADQVVDDFEQFYSGYQATVTKQELIDKAVELLDGIISSS